MNAPLEPRGLSRRGQLAVLAAAVLALVFDGVELGLTPVVSLSAAQSLLGDGFSAPAGRAWFARWLAALMLGAACGGICLGNLGDRFGRARALGISLLFFAAIGSLGVWVGTPEQFLIVRLLVGFGIGGIWPNAVALASECWGNASRAFVSGILGAGINLGILCVSQATRHWTVTASTWRRVFEWEILPALLGVLVLTLLPESPRWKASVSFARQAAPRIRELFQGGLLGTTVSGILLAAVPLVGGWTGGKWMIPWAEEAAGALRTDYKSVTQGWWALGATLGSLFGAPLSRLLGRRTSYFFISVGAAALTWSMFRFTAPLRPSFLPVVFGQGLVATLFFGWLPLYLPELFPVRVRAAGSGLAFNSGRFATAGGVLWAGQLLAQFHGDYTAIGAICSLVYLFGMLVIWRAPDSVHDTPGT